MKALNILLCIAIATVFFACDRNTTYVQEVVGPVTCGQCHDSSDLISGKQTQWAESAHGSGDAYGRGTRSSCAGCHSGSAFVEMLMAGLNPGSVEEGDPDPTRQDCRTCHKIHETYSEADWELRTEAPVALYAVPGVTFDGGHGNFCVNCHQPRRIIPEPENGIISGITTHWGPHHGPQSAMMLGVAGAGVTGSPSGHYGGVENTCVQCHMGAEENHTFEPELETCQRCHPDATDFDIGDVQSDITALADQLGDELVNRGLINENTENGHPTVTSAPEDEAIALWNWLYVAHEDQSLGVHNPGYARALLEEGLSRLGLTPVTASLRSK